MEHILTLIPLACLGVVAGFLSGLLGIGGGIVLVPGLLGIGQMVYADTIGGDILMHMALGTSLAIIIPTGMSSALAQIRRKAVHWTAVKRMVPGLVAGVSLGIMIASRLDGSTLQLVFAVGLFGIAVLIMRPPKPQHIYPGLLNWTIVTGSTVSIGCLGTLLGISGSTLNIPYMNFAGLSLRQAIASSSILGVTVAIPAAIGFCLIGASNTQLPPEFLGYINLKAWLCIVPFSILMAPLGVKMSHHIQPVKLRLILAGFILIVAVKMLWDALYVAA
jgi:uncharacterized membrane protein YfcA